LEWKLRGRTQKYILRKLAKRLGVPDEALDRPKQGFALPLVHWMRNELKEVLMTLLEPRTLQRGYFEPNGVRKLMNDHLQGRREQSARIWRLLMFELWHRNFLEKFSKPAGLFSAAIVTNPTAGSSVVPSNVAPAPARE
jgi:asparagine synthase (glutamine-hydrolysing)